jgi:uncharacterized protein (TIGR02266 family)
MPDQNLRTSRRVDLEVEVTLESEHNFYTGFSHNISSGGLFVATSSLRPVGSDLRIRFTLPGLTEPVEANAVVRWVREVGDLELRGMGVQFEQISPAAHDAIDRFITQRDTLFYDD